VRIGVFGGSFDPVHIGHLIVAEAAADALQLVRVHFVPARQQPFKHGTHLAAAEHRVAMLRVALEGNPRFRLDLREMRRPGPSYMVETLADMRAESPGDQLCLLVGADAARDLPAWHRAGELPGLAEIVILTRPGSEPSRHSLVSRSLEVPAIDVSATLVRETARGGSSIRYLVPHAVAEYVDTHGLYGPGN
jgi:nicotinate-nucleotide adenylyltransferase